MIEFEVTTDLSQIGNARLEANFDACKAALREMMEPYGAMVVTEATVPAAKADKAKINKISGRIDEMRKAVKKAYTAPLTEFEDKCKELTKICGDAAGNLAVQILDVEDRQKEEKRQEIKELFQTQIAGHVSEPVTSFVTVFRKNWLNKTVSIASIEKEMQEIIAGGDADFEAIRSLHSEFEAELMRCYTTTRALSAVMERKRDLEETRERLSREPKEAPEPWDRRADKSGTDVISVAFRVCCTVEQLQGLKQYLKDAGISYSRAE